MSTSNYGFAAPDPSTAPDFPTYMGVVLDAIDGAMHTGISTAQAQSLAAAAAAGAASSTAEHAAGTASSASAGVATLDDALDDALDRVAAVEALGGLAPGDVSDATVADLIANPATAAAAALASRFVGADDLLISARDYGAVGDGTTDDTAALQAFVDYLTATKRRGLIPAGTYRITAPLNIASAEGWSITGTGRASTTILQATDNVPIFRIGVGAETPNTPGCRMWGITDMCLRYVNNQPETNTGAICILFLAMCYQFELRGIFFYNGFYGQKVAVDQTVPWGSTWDDLYFNKHLSGGAIDWTGVRNAGPNNHFGRLFVEAQGMVGPIFIVQGYNTTVDTVEIIAAHRGPMLFRFAAKSVFTFGAVKLENAKYYAAQTLIEAPTQCHIEFGQLFISSAFNYFQPATGKIYAVAVGGGGANTYVRIGSLIAEGQPAAVESYALSGARDNRIVVDKATIGGGWRLTDTHSSQTAEMVRVDNYSNGRMSTNLGNADHAVALGGPTVLYFETALTAPRTVTLPSDSYQLTGSLTYEVVSKGAVNGSNVLRVVAGTRTLHTLTLDNHRAVFAWRRNANGANGWSLIRHEPLPTPVTA